MRITFQEVSTRRTFRWTENGKRRQTTEVFMQTINPFNKNADGAPKSREEIWKEINAKADAWLAEQEKRIAPAPPPPEGSGK
jgi:hypothetical protein